jgi:hypothetical protein
MNPVELELRFHPKEKSELSTRDFLPSDQPIVYYKRDRYPYLYLGKKYLSITYYMCYAVNYAIGLNGIMSNNASLGFHPIDVELIRIIYDYNTFFPKYVFFSAHSQEGLWFNYSDCKFNNNRLVIYVALSSHAIKPHSGVYFRIFSFANDYYSDNGKHVIPDLIEEDNSTYTFIQNEEVFSNFTKRFLMPFYIKKKDTLKEMQKKKENEMNFNL